MKPVVVLFAAWMAAVVFAGEQVQQPGAAGGQPPAEVQGRGGRGQFAEIWQKLQRGEPLTPEEQQRLERMRNMRGQGGGGMWGGFQPGMGFPWNRPAPVYNAIDQARFTVAELECESGKPDEAAKQLQLIAKDSPDEEARSEAHLRLGNLYRDFHQDKAKAIAEYRLVTGTRRPQALQAIIDLCKVKDKPEETVSALMAQVDQAADKREKVTLLTEVANTYRSTGNKEKAAETLLKIPALLTYPEAEKMKEEDKPKTPSPPAGVPMPPPPAPPAQ